MSEAHRARAARNSRITAAVRGPMGRAIHTRWERAGRTWGNAAVPCMHADPVLPDCPAGETVRVRGTLWFEGR